jgi:hypothetical protein
MSPRIQSLAHEWTDDQPTPYLKAKAIEDHLKRDFRYDTASPSGGKPNPVDHFLFESKRGHCEFFSTAMALMLREIGIPSRNVTGFVGGVYNRFGRYYAVREGDAHSWIEAYLDDPIRSWVTFDPTPNAGAQPLQDTTGAYVYMRDLVEALSQRWNRYVVGYDLKTQVRIFDDLSRGYERMRARTGANHGWLERITRGPVLATGGLAILAGVYIAWKRRKKPASAAKLQDERAPLNEQQESATSLYRGLERALIAQGIARPAARPPLRHAETLAEGAHPLAADVLALTHRYLRARFGGAPMNATAARDYETRVKAIRAFKRNDPREAPPN